MNTLVLDPVSWDLVLDTSGNIAMATEPYSLAQDAASVIRTFLGECWYNVDLGLPYWEKILGVTPTPSIPYLKALFRAAALTVPDVVAAQVFIYSIVNRVVAGQVQTTNKNGVISAATF